ncbi:MAG: pyridoxine 5'-phosphate synthase [Fidelibacterota bacterium]
MNMLKILNLIKKNQSYHIRRYLILLKRIYLNAGHDLNLENLDFILKEIPTIKEVSIGHALVCDAFTFGLEDTIKKYKLITGNN